MAIMILVCLSQQILPEIETKLKISELSMAFSRKDE